MDDIAPPNAVNIESVQILRTKRSDVFTRRGVKLWRAIYNKGRVVRGMNAEPFGYRGSDDTIIGAEEESEQSEENHSQYSDDDGQPRIPCNIQ